MLFTHKHTPLPLFLTISAALVLPILFYCLVDQSDINALIQSYQPQTVTEYLIFFTLLVLTMSIGLPRQIAAFSTGYLLGTFYGTLFTTVAASLACLLTFMCAKFIFHRRLSQRFPKQLGKLTHFFQSDVFVKALIIRLIPAGSNFLTNVLAGAAKAPFMPYITGTMVGFIPQMVLFSMLGAGVNVGDNQQIIISVVLVIIAGVLVTYLVKKSRFAQATIN